MSERSAGDQIVLGCCAWFVVVAALVLAVLVSVALSVG